MKPIVVSLPATMLVLASVGGATAQMTQADPNSIRRSLIATGIILLAVSATSGEMSAIAGTAIGVGAVAFVTRDFWPWMNGNN
jgi:hypothetical protein